MTKIRIETNTYLRSHGRTPKGRGYWGFIVMDGYPSPVREYEKFFVPGSWTLTEAKARARAIVRERYSFELGTGYLYLEVAP